MNSRNISVLLLFTVFFQTVITLKKSSNRKQLNGRQRSDNLDPDLHRFLVLASLGWDRCSVLTSTKFPPFEVWIQFYTRENDTMESMLIPRRYYLIDDFYAAVIKEKQRKDKTLVILIHGWLQDGQENWLQDLKNAYLKNVDCTVGIVVWSSRSVDCHYGSAAWYAIDVAEQLRDLIRVLRLYGVDTSQIHLIGHGMGAHIAGMIGKYLPSVEHKIKRITGLDPASSKIGSSPDGHDFQPLRRLESTDAEQVDVIHSSTLGMDDQLGHIDIYTNGGERLECENSPPLTERMYILTAYHFYVDSYCTHQIAYKIFIESITNRDCKFIATDTESRAKHLKGNISNPDSDTVVGLDIFKYKVRGKLYLYTNTRSPFCKRA